MDELTDAKRIQLAWMNNHPVQDKDKAYKREIGEKKEETKNYAKRKRNPASWNFPIPEQEIDLHGYVAEEAVAAVENLMDGMERSGLTVLRVIHGGGNPEYGNVKHYIDRSCATIWKNRVAFYRTEPDNAGSSIMKLGKPVVLDAKGKKSR